MKNLKTSHNRRCARRATCCLVLFVVTALFAFGPAVAEERALHPVVYGGSTWLGHYPVWVGMKKGLFKEQGVEISFRQFHASSARMGSLVAGNLDFASTGSISALALMAYGVRSFFVPATQDSYATVEGIIATKEVSDVSGLKGKKVAVTFASSAHVLVLDVLERNGLEPGRDVSLINLKVSEMPAAFRSGEVDACAAWTPYFSRLLAMEGARLLLDDRSFSLHETHGIGPGPDVLVVSKKFAERSPETTRSFLNAYFQSVDLLISHPDECAGLLTELTGLDREDQLAVLKDVQWFNLKEQQRLLVDPGAFSGGLQLLASFLERHGQIDRTPEVKNWLRPDLLP
jgi:taurine transport system substrate-binding protein